MPITDEELAAFIEAAKELEWTENGYLISGNELYRWASDHPDEENLILIGYFGTKH
jgi:hypothetical protein